MSELDSSSLSDENGVWSPESGQLKSSYFTVFLVTYINTKIMPYVV